MNKRMLMRTALVMFFVGTLGLQPARAATTPEKLDGVKVINAEQVQQLQAKGVPIIDTRVSAEYADKTIKGALSVPYKEKSAKAVDFDRKLDNFDLSKLPADKSAQIVFFCNSGECWKSYKASVLARDSGYKQVLWYRDGFPDWTAKGMPTQ